MFNMTNINKKIGSKITHFEEDGICFEDPQMALQVASAWHTPIQSSGTERYIVTLPEILRQFVRDFDLGAYRIFA